ncbi:MAG: flavin reductase family protein [candidate division Zixibacteria bacterium]|nr:flavin reductase family protein [candidate division Zixibacteria bacterium]
MKQPLNANLLSPLLVVLIGAVVDGRPNYMVVGYVAPFDFGKHIFFSLYKKRYTHQGIMENKTFSVNIPNELLLAEINICGSTSGRDVDKSTLFDTFYGGLKTAPMIRQCPIAIGCELHDTLDYGENVGIIGRVVKSYVDQKYLHDGNLDFREIRPIIWATGGDFNYYGLGNRVVRR